MSPQLDHDKPFQQEVIATAGAFSLPIIIPGWVSEIVATAIPGGGGSATVQHTTDEPQSVEDNPGAANWVNWDEGSVTVITSQAAMGTVTAVRIQAVTQDATLQVAANKRRQ